MDQFVSHVRSLHLGVTDLERSLAFYTDVWGLQQVGSEGGRHYLRVGGYEHHAVVLSAADTPALLGISFAVSDRAGLDAIAASLSNDGAIAISAVRALPAAAGGGVGLDITSPDGLIVTLSADVARHPEPLPDRTIPAKLSHVVINTGYLERQLRFFVDHLGFRLSDNTDRQYFLRCGKDHHSLALGVGSGLSLNHAAFEMADFDALMHGSGRVVGAGMPIEWGPGRHGPGNNIFCYFIDPDGFAIEYTTEVAQIEEPGYQARDAAYWASLPRRPCLWGVAGRPSPRMVEAFAGRSASAR